MSVFSLDCWGSSGKQTSRIGTSFPCMSQTSFITSYIVGRFCGFSLSMIAVPGHQSAVEFFPNRPSSTRTLTNQRLQPIGKLRVCGEFVTGVEDGHLPNLFEGSRIVT